MNRRKAPIADLPRGVNVLKTVNGNGREFWRVRLGKRFTGGEVVKRDFSNLKSAREWIFGEGNAQAGAVQSFRTEMPGVIELQKKCGASAFGLTPAQIQEASWAFQKLEGASLTDAIRYYLAHARPKGGVKTFEEAVEALIHDKRQNGTSEKHLKGLSCTLGRMRESFADRKVHEISAAQIEEWLSEQAFSLTTRFNYIRDLRILLNYAVRRKWCTENAAGQIEKPRLIAAGVSVLSPVELQKFMAATVREAPDMVVALAIKWFAGLRTSELLQLEWSDVRENHIIVGAKIAKTRSRRVVTIRPNLSTWLAQRRKSQGPVAPIAGNAWHLRVQELSEQAEIMLPPNVMRHSFGSYFLALTGNENLTANEMGNTPAIVHRNYKELVTSDQAKAYFDICGAQPS